MEALKDTMRTARGKITLTAWGICWLVWLSVQHLNVMLHWSTLDGSEVNLSEAHRLCSSELYALAKQVSGPTQECMQQSSYWAASTVLFWFGLIALAAFGVIAYRNSTQRMPQHAG